MRQIPMHSEITSIISIKEKIESHSEFGTKNKPLPFALVCAFGYPDYNLGVIRLSEFGTDEPLCRFEGHKGKITDMIFVPSVEAIFSCSEDSTVKLWYLNGTLLHSLNSHKGVINSICLMSNGATLISGGNDKKLAVYEINKSPSKINLEITKEMHEDSPIT